MSSWIMLGFDQLFLWALLLLLLGIGCIVLELFVPSGGMLGVLATLAICAALILAFMSGPWQGTGMTVAVTLLIPLILAIAVKFWPHTPLGKLMLLSPPENADDLLPDSEASRIRNDLLGKYGIATSAMLPSGVVVIEGHAYEAISSGMPIETGQSIKVIGIEMQRLMVQAEQMRAGQSSVSSGASPTTPSPSATSPLSDEMEDPFA